MDETRFVAYPDLPTHYVDCGHTTQQVHPGGRGVLVADIISRHELPVPRSDEVSVVSTSFSTVASLDTADISNSEMGNYSSQERVDEPVFEQDVGSDEEALPPHDLARDSRLQSFGSSSSSDYSDDLTIAEWSEIGIEADHEVEVRASQLTASQVASQVAPPQAVPLQRDVLRTPVTRVLRPRPAQRSSISTQHTQEPQFDVTQSVQSIDSGPNDTFQKLSSLWRKKLTHSQSSLSSVVENMLIVLSSITAEGPDWCTDRSAMGNHARATVLPGRPGPV